MTTRSKRNVKCLSAVIGGSAVMALGALSMALGHEQAGPPADVAGSKMTVGQTSTETTAPGGSGHLDGGSGHQGTGPPSLRRPGRAWISDNQSVSSPLPSVTRIAEG